MTIALLVCVCHSARALSQAEEDRPAESAVLGTPADLGRAGGLETIVLAPRTRLRQAPRPDAPVVVETDVTVELEIIERRGDWVSVLFAGRKGWIAAVTSDGSSEVENPAVGVGNVAVVSLAREVMAIEEPALDIGSFDLHTDLVDASLLDFVIRLAEGLPSTYKSRYGLDVSGGFREALLVFSREQDYRRFAAATSAASNDAQGHAAGGIAAVFVDSQTRSELGAILVHEVTHLLNRRAFARAPAPWLEEGLANDLAYCRIEDSGRLVPATLGGRSVAFERHVYLAGGSTRVDREIRLVGPRAALDLLRMQQQQRELEPLKTLVGLRREDFDEPSRRRQRADQSAFFVRYLLAGESDELATRFRAFLGSLAGRETAEPAVLPAVLQTSWDRLQSGFEEWLSTSIFPPD